MNIVHVMGMGSTKYGGLEKFLIHLMQESPDDKYYLIYNTLSQGQEFLKKLEEVGGEIIVLNTIGINYIKNALRFVKLCMRIKPNVLHFHFGNSFLLYLPIARLLGVRRTYMTQHNCFYSGREQINRKDKLPSDFRFWSFNGSTYSLFTKILCVSEYTKKSIC